MSKPRKHLVKSEIMRISVCMVHDVPIDNLTKKPGEVTCKRCLAQMYKDANNPNHITPESFGRAMTTLTRRSRSRKHQTE